MLDPNGMILSWNEGAERIKGYTREEIIGKHFSVFYPEEAIRSKWPETELENAAKTGRFEDEGWRIRKDRSRFWANVVITTLYQPDGSVRGYLKITRDLTERMRSEEGLRHAQAELEMRASEVTSCGRTATRSAFAATARCAAATGFPSTHAMMTGRRPSRPSAASITASLPVSPTRTTSTERSRSVSIAFFAPFDVPASIGIPRQVQETVIAVPNNDLAAVERVLAADDDIRPQANPLTGDPVPGLTESFLFGHASPPKFHA
jgi:PAS domain S-box-containing protein